MRRCADSFGQHSPKAARHWQAEARPATCKHEAFGRGPEISLVFRYYYPIPRGWVGPPDVAAGVRQSGNRAPKRRYY